MNNFQITPKKIFIVLGIVILIEVIYAVKVLTAPAVTLAPAKNTIQTPPPLNPGRISLISGKKILKVGEAVAVTLEVDTGGHAVGGADVIVKFDPSVMEATAGALAKGKIFDEYPALSIDKNKGIISISGVTLSNKGFAGKDVFATVSLKPKKAGKTSLAIDFTKGSTIDSNLVEIVSSSDILENVDNLELTVQ